MQIRQHIGAIVSKTITKNLFENSVRKILFTTFGVGLVFPLILSAATFGLSDIPRDFEFNKTLKQGVTVAPDVSYLQFILNQSTDTQVAETGAGSPTGLTNFFGSKTHSAVTRFQEKYRAEILTPANIGSPTGIVGENTRRKLNQILAGLFSGTYIESNNSSSLGSSLSASASGSNTNTNSPNLFKLPVTSANTSATNSQSTVKQPPVVSSFSTFKALSGQLMSLFGAQFHPTKNTVYLGSEKVGDYPSLDNGTKITFKVPATLATGSYEVGLVNSYGTTSTGFLYLNVVKQATTSSSVAQSFTPSLTALYPASSKNLNDLIFISGENLSFNNTLETNLGNTIVKSTNRKTLSFMISELPYYMEAFKKYKGQSINVIMKIRNENGLSSQQLVHVINFPNTDEPTINLSSQQPPASFNTNTLDDAAETALRRDFERLSASLTTFGTTGTSTRSTSTSSQSSTGSSGATGSNSGDSSDESTESSGLQLDPATQQLKEILGGSLLIRTIIENSPVHQFVLGPIINSGSGGSSGGGGLGGFGGGGSSGGGSGGSGGSGGGSGQVTFFGGQITQVTYCTCSAAILLAIKDIPSSQTLQVFFRYGQSTLHANYNIFTTNINVIGGLTQGGGQCQVYSGNSCSTEGNAQYTIDTIRGVGTGMTSGM